MAQPTTTTTTDDDETLLKSFRTMRDINDYCEKKKIPSISQGMIELPPPQVLREIASKLVLSDNIHTYRCRHGETQYREAIRQLLKKQYSTEVPMEAILATHGVSGGLVASIHWLNMQGKTKLGLIEPFYTYHIFQIKRIFGEDKDPVYLKSLEDFSPNWEAIEAALEQGLDGILLCNPGNPSGRVWSKEELDRLANLTSAKNCLLILDECYSDMVWDDKVHYSPIQSGLRDNIVVARGFSKVLGAQSWRVGYLVSTPKMVDELMRVADPVYICVSWVQHALGLYLSEHYEDFCEHKVKVGKLIRRNWKVLSAALQQAFGWTPIEPGGSMYGMFKHGDVGDMEAVIKALKKGVGLCPASMFFANSPKNTGFVRIHCGISEEKADDIVRRLTQTS